MQASEARRVCPSTFSRLSNTAKYTKIDSGYLGQLIEWPEVVTEGESLEDCRGMLQDALEQMVLSYRDLGREVPVDGAHSVT
jgi:predicted RNase H-like HicB family nuclease